MNPSLIRNATPPGSDYYLKVPVGHAKFAEEKQSELYALKKFNSPTYVSYRVRSGDTLGGIARKYGTSVSSIKRNNKLNGNLIRIGQRLSIPTKYAGSSATYASSSSTSKSSYKSTSNPLYHTVRRGDTVGGISSRYGVRLASLKSANNLKGNTIYPGQKLTIPGKSVSSSSSNTVSKATTHKVRNGDTLSEIAVRYGVSLHSLKRENNITGNNIRVGQVLRLPTKIYAKSSSSTSNLISYNVIRGDNLWDIARKHNVSVSSIKKWNNLTSSKLDQGDVLKIYVK